MRSTCTLHVAICTFSFLLGSSVGAGENSLEKAKKSFEVSKKEADKRMVRAFEKAIDALKKDKRIPVETRSRHAAAMEAEKKRFELSNDLPASDVMLKTTVEYLNLVHSKRVLLQKEFQKSLEDTIDDRTEFNRISADKALFDAKLPSRDEFVSGSNWHGNRTFSGGNAIDFHLHVFQIENNSFKGHIWQDVHSISGKSGWEFEGNLEGNVVTLTTTKMLHGGARRLELAGFVIGRRLILTARVNGKPIDDFVSVGKQ